jgi:VanZ family protein
VTDLPLRDFARPRLWLRLWLMLLGLTLLVCLVPLPSVPVPMSHFDKLEHALGYAVLSAYAAMLFARGRGLRLAILGLALFGGVIEVLQGVMPWRSADPLDAVFNTLGAVFGALIWFTPAAGALQWADRRLLPR